MAMLITNLRQETTGKTQPLQLTFRNPPDNYFFMSWNWPLVRKISSYTFLAGLFAMVAVVVAMIATLPRKCNPPTQWYQGTVFYEIFPASYHDANHNMVGDFEGIKRNIDYIKGLGVRGVRLNSIFKTENYPENYKNTTTLIEIAHQLGTLEDLKTLVTTFKNENISILLDLPVWPAVKQLTNKGVIHDNETVSEFTVEFMQVSPIDEVEKAIVHWTQVGIEGFYLKGLEHFLNDSNFEQSLKRWKEVLGYDRIFIVSEEVLNEASEAVKLAIINNVDLVDVRLKVEAGSDAIVKQIEVALNGKLLYPKSGVPWIHWSLGDENTVRLANRLAYANGTLGATLFQLMLPGTSSIFYGDEIGLQQVYDPNGERKDVRHLHHLNMMPWPNKQQELLMWLQGDNTDVNFEQTASIANMTKLREVSPSIYMNSLCKQGQTKPNTEVKYPRKDLLVIQRWYPRRKRYVVVSNFGKSQIEADLSTLLYSGSTKVGPRPDSTPQDVTFKQISMWPGESVVIELH